MYSENLPKAGVDYPEITSKSQFSTVKKITKEERNAYRDLRESVRIIEDAIPKRDITDIEFSLFSTEEKRKMAVVLCYKPDDYGANTVRDDYLGPRNQSERCLTCNQDLINCPGHHGLIEHPNFFEPLAQDQCKDTLESVCPVCSNLLISEEDIISKGFDKLPVIKRVSAIANYVKKSKVTCKFNSSIKGIESCSDKKGGTPIPQYLPISTNDKDYCLLYNYGGTKTTQKYRRTPDEAFIIFDNITDRNATLLGYGLRSHPRNLIRQNTLVAPYNIRPDLNQVDLSKADDLTIAYQEIIRCVNKINEDQKNLKDQSLMNALYGKIRNIAKNEVTKGYGMKEASDIKKKLQGKEGIIRKNMMGKRNDHSGRSVVGPGVNLRVDEVGIPQDLANKCTYPEVCTGYNSQECQAEYDNNRVISIEKINDDKNIGNLQVVSDKFRINNPNYQIQVGDKIHRLLKDGDIVIINRQPSLHKESMLALRCKILTPRNLKINLSITTPLGADFDGDEINLYIPQTLEARIEAEQLLSVAANLMSGENNKTIMHIVYNSLLSAYILTRDEELELLKYDENIKDFEEERNHTKIILEIEKNNTDENIKKELTKHAKDEYTKVLKKRADERRNNISKYFHNKRNFDNEYKIILDKKNNYKFTNPNYYSLKNRLDTISPKVEEYENEYKTLLVSGTNTNIENLKTFNQLQEYKNEYDKISEEIQKIIDDDKDYQLILSEFKKYEKRVGILPKDDFELVYERARDNPAIETLRERLEYNNVPWQSKRALFSAALPETFNYDNYNVLIKDGVLISGVIDKKTIGSTDNSIISQMIKDLGGYVTVDFMSNIQFILYEYLDLIGFSLGIKDCLPVIGDQAVEEFQTELENYIKEVEVQAVGLSEQRTKNKFEERKKELKIKHVLGVTKEVGDNWVIRKANINNGFIYMANAGSKGSSLNFAQITSLVGQQNVNDERIIANLPGNRTLPTYEPNSKNPESRGFVSKSFYSGLEPESWFFHSAAVRENLTDTAVNTRRTGDLQHNLIKTGEDCHISADGAVRGADGTIVQFVYGEDGLNPSELSQFNIMGQQQLLFRNIEHVTFNINTKYEKLIRTGLYTPTNNPNESLVPKKN